MLAKLFKKPEKKEEQSSNFSRFFREASAEEKKRVFLEVARQASKEQLETIRNAEVARP